MKRKITAEPKIIVFHGPLNWLGTFIEHLIKILLWAASKDFEGHMWPTGWPALCQNKEVSFSIFL